MLTADEIVEEFIRDSKFFHFGTLFMTHEGVREATKKHSGSQKSWVVSYFLQSESLHASVEQPGPLPYPGALGQWFPVLTGKESYTESMEWFCEGYPLPLILDSMAKEESRAYYNDIITEATPSLKKIILNNCASHSRYFQWWVRRANFFTKQQNKCLHKPIHMV